jgi:glycosyltransferase involved in cell wall biosynthesis
MNNVKDIPLIQNICIVVPTYNRASILSKSLKKYLEIDHIKEATILVIDNNSSDHTAQTVHDFREYSNLNVVYYFEAQQGLSFAKNKAIELCTQDYMLFLDDDCYPQKDILVHCAHHISASRKAIFGKINRWAEMVPAWILNEFFIHNHPSDIAVDLKSCLYFKGCIAMLSKEMLQEIGGFNLSLGMRGCKSAYGEDTDLAARLMANGEKIRYDPAVAIYHCSHQNSVQSYYKSYLTLGRNSYEVNHVNHVNHSRIKLYLWCIKKLIRAPFIFMGAWVGYRNVKTALVKAGIPVALALGRISGAYFHQK